MIITFAYLARMFWLFSKKKQDLQIKLLLRTISLFIVLHMILFPIVYVFMINQNTDSIQINENINAYERETKLQEAKNIAKEIDSISNSKNKKLIIGAILDSNQKYLETVDWISIDNDRIIFLESNLIRGYTQYRTIPSDVVHRVVTIYDSKGEKLLEFQTRSEEEKLSEVLVDYLQELDAEKNDINKRIETIQANAFWSYRQILPYTLNILFTDNFNPQSRTANFVNFLHNILVLGFILNFIMNMFQYYLLKK